MTGETVSADKEASATFSFVMKLEKILSLVTL